LPIVLLISGPWTEGALIVIALRLLVPLLIFRYNLFGAILAMLLDGVDVILVDLMSIGGFEGHYHTTDKILDSWYLAIELIVALGWDNPWAKWPAVALFAYRAVGVVLFEVTQARIALFIFPNLFENWWLYVVIVAKWWPHLSPASWKSTLVPLFILLVPKMAQEYLLHFAEAQPWDWTKDNILHWD
jgi:hypothetical protein